MPLLSAKIPLHPFVALLSLIHLILQVSLPAAMVRMAPKMKLSQRRKSVRELEENVRRKRQAAQSSTAPTPASVSAQGPSQSSLSPVRTLYLIEKLKPKKMWIFDSLKKRVSPLE